VRIRSLRRVGGSVMVALPPGLLDRLGARAGDRVALVPVDGGVLVTLYDHRFDLACKAIELVHRRYLNGLRRLAGTHD
jgi:antitoxin component of MazEF toxin-antitoxin module